MKEASQMSIRPRPAPIAVALDAPDLETAARWASLVTPHVSTVKIGLELYLRYGPSVVASVRGASRVQIFLDLKLHDIPATVAGAARVVGRLRPALLTVHAAGGQAMIRAAVDAAPDTRIAAVTVLTSLSEADLAQAGIAGSVPDVARRLAVASGGAGARAPARSPEEVPAVPEAVCGMTGRVCAVCAAAAPTWSRRSRISAEFHDRGNFGEG